MKTLYVNIDGENIQCSDELDVVGKPEDAVINKFYFELVKGIVKGVTAPGIGERIKQEYDVIKQTLLGENPKGDYVVELPDEYIVWLHNHREHVCDEIAKSLVARENKVKISIEKIYRNAVVYLLNNIDTNKQYNHFVVNDNFVDDDSSIVSDIHNKIGQGVSFITYDDWKRSEENKAQEQTLKEVQEREEAEKKGKTKNKKEESDGYINGHEYVDLGLPSGLKWATCNVGADSPEEYGDYYAWGETYTKDEYEEENCDLYGDEMEDIGGDPDYDVATSEWGEGWRLPTQDECEELVEECEWKWMKKKRVWGMRVTGPNGNSIFLPAAGYRYGSSLDDAGEYGNFWSSTPYESDSDGAFDLGFSSDFHYVGWSYRSGGQSVRPVSE